MSSGFSNEQTVMTYLSMRLLRSFSLCGSFLLEALRDNRGDAISAHRDAVEGVCDLHCALLVRDNQQLAVVAQLLKELDQAPQIHVIEGGFYLVQDIERAGAGLEEGYEYCDCGQRSLAA